MEELPHIQSIDDVLTHPQLLAGKTPQEVEARLGNSPGWRVETLGRGAHKGQGWVLREYKQLPLSSRQNGLPVKRIDWSRLMICEHSTCALIELMQIGKTPSSTDPVLHHAPEACNRIEMVSTMRRQEMQPKLLVPVGERRRELMRPVDATAVGHHDHLFASVAKAGQHLMDVLAKPLCLKMGDNLIEDFRGAILDRPNDTEQHPAGDPAPGAIGTHA